MPAVRPLTDAEHAKIRELHAAGKSRNEIAKALGRSGSTISVAAERLGLSFDRGAQVAAATQVAKIDAAARRAELANRLIERAHGFLDQLDEPHLVFKIGGKDNTYTEHQLERPHTGAIRDLMVSAAIALDKHLAIVRHDADPGTDAARSLLADIGRAIGIAADALDPETPPEP